MHKSMNGGQSGANEWVSRVRTGVSAHCDVCSDVCSVNSFYSPSHNIHMENFRILWRHVQLHD